MKYKITKELPNITYLHGADCYKTKLQSKAEYCLWFYEEFRDKWCNIFSGDSYEEAEDAAKQHAITYKSYAEFFLNESKSC